MVSRPHFLTIGLLLGFAASAAADVVATFDSGDVLGSLVTFDEMPNGQITNPALFYNDGKADGFMLEDFQGLHITGFRDNFVLDTQPFLKKAEFTIVFNEPVSAVGFDVVHLFGPDAVIVAYDVNGATLGSNQTGRNRFLGLRDQDNLPVIKSVYIHDSTFGFLIDNFRYIPTHAPAPGAALLCSLGLGMVACVRRRRA